MARPRIPHSPTDSAIAKLYEATSTPHRLPQISATFPQLLRQVSNPAHRQFLDRKFHEIEIMHNSPQDLARISNEIDAWSDREFPVQGKSK